MRTNVNKYLAAIEPASNGLILTNPPIGKIGNGNSIGNCYLARWETWNLMKKPVEVEVAK